MTILEVKRLTVAYGSGRNAVTAATDVSLSVKGATTTGIVGESGSGKSSIARAIVGLAPIVSGEVAIDGEVVADIRGCRDRRRRVQMVFQDPAASLNPRMTVGSALQEAAHCTQRGRDDLRTRVHELLDLVALEPRHAELLPRELSGGQRQRVAIARALAAEPRVLVADEITSALDASVQGAVLNLLRDLQEQLSLTVLFISHNLAVVRYVSDEIAVMHGGRIVELGESHQVVSSASHPYTQGLLDCVPEIGHRLPPGAARISTIDDAGTPEGGCGFRARCPVGPLTRPERVVCSEITPELVRTANEQQVACHYAHGSAVGADRAGA